MEFYCVKNSNSQYVPNLIGPYVTGQGGGMSVNFEALKVMVVDDSNTIRRTAETILSKAGCDVVTAVDGFDSLAKIVDVVPDVIFVDIMMPRLDGYQTCALIKNNNEFKQTPVIMLSSKDGLFDKAKGRIVGADEYLTKPFSKNELFDVLERIVTPKAMEGTSIQEAGI
jgi:twitching motility two-component system response regulator PilG|tara:strand:- start:136 stop:642 length:507 start_codon:yes stop_codon:yes gene_type:complete